MNNSEDRNRYWKRITELPRHKVSDLRASSELGDAGWEELTDLIDLDEQIYVLLRDGEPVYIASGLTVRDQVDEDFFWGWREPGYSDLVRRVAEHLQIDFALSLKSSRSELCESDLGRIRDWLNECELVFLDVGLMNPDKFAARCAKERNLLLQHDKFDLDALEKSQRKLEAQRERRAAKVKEEQYLQTEAKETAAALKRRETYEWLAIVSGTIISSLIVTRLVDTTSYFGAAYEFQWFDGDTIFTFIISTFCLFWAVILIHAWPTEIKNWPMSISIPITVLLLPAVLMVGWLIFFSADYQRQRESFNTFDRYFDDIPPSKLGDPFFTWVSEDDEDLNTVCADLGKQDRSDYICAEMDLALPNGKQITGGFETREFEPDIDDDGYIDDLYYEPHDCWGNSEVCDQQ